MEERISRLILERGFEELKSGLSLDVAIAGGGASGLVAAKYLAEKKKKVGIFEKRLSLGGGMWGGGMLFPYLIFEKSAIPILKDFKIDFTEKEDLLITKSVETVGRLIIGAVEAGVKIYNGISVEDLVVRKDRVAGVAIEWTAVEMASLHIDPLAVLSQFVIDATGHEAVLCHIAEKKVGPLFTKSGKVEGEKSLWVEEGEPKLLSNTREVYPGLFVTGMAANNAFGGERMGPIFGGMFLSGKKVAAMIDR